MSKIYQYIGAGKGVPGLPHRLTDADVTRLGVETLLADALKAKTYEVVKTAATELAVEETTEKAEKNSAKHNPAKREEEA